MNNKMCLNCGKVKNLSNFGKYLFENKYVCYVSYCKDCVKYKTRQWKQNNIDKVRIQNRKRSLRIGTRIFDTIRKRCQSKNGLYFKKGIKHLLTPIEIENLWERDRAYLLKRPSIDRIDSNGNYEFKNCRFIELSENIRLAHKK